MHKGKILCHITTGFYTTAYGINLLVSAMATFTEVTVTYKEKFYANKLNH